MYGPRIQSDRIGHLADRVLNISGHPVETSTKDFQECLYFPPSFASGFANGYALIVLFVKNGFNHVFVLKNGEDINLPATS